MTNGKQPDYCQAHPQPLILPFHASYPCTQDYAGHLAYSNAPGLDFAMPHGTPVYAAAAGQVTYAQWGARGGRYLIIDHGDLGPDYCQAYPHTLTLYSHLYLFYVAKGEYVSQNELIALSDNTGSSSTGPHLHFAVKQEAKWIDPEPLLAART